MRRVEGENWRERVVGKAAGDEHVFIAGRGSGWQMKPDQTRRAVREVTGPLNRITGLITWVGCPLPLGNQWTYVFPSIQSLIDCQKN
jgi:hypothetical protein